MNASDPFAAALRLLTGREHSTAELTVKLARRGFTEQAVAAAVERCRELGYLDDDRYARCRARSLMASGRAVGNRLLQELRRSGVAPEIAAAALAEARQECSEEQLLAELADRRFPDFSWNGAAERERRRVVNYFLRRGFPSALVLSYFQQER